MVVMLVGGARANFVLIDFFVEYGFRWAGGGAR